MSVKLLTELHLEFLSLKGGCTGSSESPLVKMPHRWKSLVAAQMLLLKAGIHKMLVWKANREDHDQTSQSDLGLRGFSRLFWQAISV